MLGKLLNYEIHENLVKLAYENGKAQIQFLQKNIVNFFAGDINDRKSFAVTDFKCEKMPVVLSKIQDGISITNGSIKVNVYDDFYADIYNHKGELIVKDYRGQRKLLNKRGSFELAEKEGHKVSEDLQIHPVEKLKCFHGDECIYGLGEKTGHLNKKGYYFEMWNTDDPSAHTEAFSKLYKTIPFFMAVKDNFSYGIFFDNTFKSYFDMGKESSSYYYFGADGGNLDYYFMYGEKPQDIVLEYTALTGKTPMPNLWSLGYQQCRWSYGSKERLFEVADEFRKRDIPCDVLYLDIDYMDGFRVFTWDKDNFKNPKTMIDDLNKKGFRLVTIIDPGVKKDKGYKIYDEAMENKYYATDKDGMPYVNWVWPGNVIYPNFLDERVRSWWAKNQSILLKDGVSGIWNDMNEPASFNGALPNDIEFNSENKTYKHEEIHNVYGSLMAMSASKGIKDFTKKRPFVITRACYAGVQKYSTVWTGDNQSLWEHLRMSVPMLMNLGLSGVTFCGTDVGGFGHDCTPELLSRWVQVGCFTPLFRNHSAIKTRDQEPWAFDEKTEEINRKYIKLRYKFLPYLYDMFYEHQKTGLPVLRPLFLYFKDKEVMNLNDEFLFGDNILVSPVLEQGKTRKLVYLPEGDWYDYWNHNKISGKSYFAAEAPLDTCPMYVKEGSIIPNYEVMNYVGEKPYDNLIIEIYKGKADERYSYVTYEDDGESFDYEEGKYNLYMFEYVTTKALESFINIESNINLNNHSYKTIEFKLIGIKAENILVNGASIEFSNVDGICTFKVSRNSDSIKIEIK